MLFSNRLECRRAPEGDPPGGGGEQPKYLTEEKFGEMFNQAFTAKWKNTEAKLTKSIGDSIAEALKPIHERLDKPPEPKPDDKVGDKPDPKVTALESKLADLDKKYADEKAAREKAELARRDDAARASLAQAFAGHIRPEAVADVVDLMFARGKVAFDEQGKPLLTVSRKSGGVEEDVQVTFQDGAQMWAKGPGAIYAPPPAGGGQQQQRGTAPTRQPQLGPDGLPRYDKPATTDEDKARRSMERTEAIERRRAAGQI